MNLNIIMFVFFSYHNLLKSIIYEVRIMNEQTLFYYSS